MIGPDRKQLSGLVEVDETFIGGAKSGKRGRGAEGKTLVLVAVEDHDDAVFGQVRLQTVPDASGKSLNNFIKTHIEPASSVRTDGWRGYSKVDELGYEHIVSGGRDSEEAVSNHRLSCPRQPKPDIGLFVVLLRSHHQLPSLAP